MYQDLQKLATIQNVYVYFDHRALPPAEDGL